MQIIELQEQLEQYQFVNGLFPAAVGSKNRLMKVLCWIRDNYYVSLSVSPTSKLRIGKTFQTIVDLEIKAGKFKFPPNEDRRHIHPVRKRNLKELGRKWGFVQNDSVGNLLEVMVDMKDEYRASKLIKYLNMIEFWKCADAGFWEEVKELRSSSLAACLRGLESYRDNFGDNQNLRKIINKGYESLLSILPNETPTRSSDLALLSLIYPGKLNHNIITRDLKEKILENVKPLIGEHGIKRYLGDTWDGKTNSLGKGREMEWLMGKFWYYLCTGDKEHFLEGKELRKEYGSYEGFVNEKPNATSFLIWTEAMNILAEMKFRKENYVK